MRPRLTAVALALALVLPLAGCFGSGGGKDKTPVPATGDDVPLVGQAFPGIGVAPLPPVALPWFPSDGASERTTLEIPSFDAHMIPITIYRPLVANATQQVPVLLHSHGFTGKRTNTDDGFMPLVAAGFGVVSFDERGHGDSMDDSEVYFMHPDYEVQDVIKVIDYVSTFDWVLMESPATASGPRDPVLGAIGGSYGGAYQLMGAIFDPRLDSLVPEITWNDIAEALATNGAIKSGWIDLFYVGGTAQQSVVFADDFLAGFAWATAANTFPAGQAPGIPDLHSRFKEASPVSYPGGIRIPTLLIQGMPDTLFPLNQAVANLRALEAFNVESALYTHNGGHILQVNSLRANTTPVPVGLQGMPGGKPCGTLTDLQVAWHQTHLLGLGNWTGRPRVCIALEDETTVVGATFPLEGTVVQEFTLPGPTPVAQAPAGPRVPLNLFTATADTIVAGIPRLKGTITLAGADSIVYFSLQRADPTSGLEAIIDDQVMPMRISEPVTSPRAFELDLGGVATRLKAGEQLLLVVSTVEPVYAGNAERVPGAVVLGDLVLELPTLPNDTPTMTVPA
ncbi:MAG: CocE/NonD family hydrolase [Candidatus Thermoplasmatota archaeon]